MLTPRRNHCTATGLAAVLPAALLTGMLLLAASPAVAAPPVPPNAQCTQVDPTTGLCLVSVTQPGSGTSGAQGAAGAGSSGGKGPAITCQASAFDGAPVTVPCSGGGGWWSASLNCYVNRMTPQPPRSDPVWAGNTTGAIYTCTPPVGPPRPVWLAAAPAVAVNPAVLARQAVEAMNLKAITVGIVPQARPGSVGILGMPTWLWAAQPSATTIGPVTRSASAGPATVTATAHVDRIVWDLGDGTTLACTGPGTPYADSYGRSPSPTCGHMYTKPGTYTVTATSYWLVDWAGLGQTGRITLDLSQSVTVTIGEAQVVAG